MSAMSKDGKIVNKKIIDSMKLFAENYAKSTHTFFCSNFEVTESVIQGLSKNKELLGVPLCPCRYYDNKEDEVSLAYWNCPCVPMRERKECHCMLFLTSENEFSSKEQKFKY
jgi:ferredoxin-thioredoxin reductase catalytic chain